VSSRSGLLLRLLLVAGVVPLPSCFTTMLLDPSPPDPGTLSNDLGGLSLAFDEEGATLCVEVERLPPEWLQHPARVPEAKWLYVRPLPDERGLLQVLRMASERTVAYPEAVLWPSGADEPAFAELSLSASIGVRHPPDFVAEPGVELDPVALRLDAAGFCEVEWSREPLPRAEAVRITGIATQTRRESSAVGNVLRIVAVPITLAADIVTFPFQLFLPAARRTIRGG
jgi:hypothetical protein